MAFRLVDEYPPNSARGAGTGGGCFTCGCQKRTTGTQAYHPTGEYLIDLGVETDKVVGLDGEHYGGTIPVICETCALELAALVGCLTPTQSKRLKTERDNYRHRLLEAEAQVGEYETLKSELRKVQVT
jgi:hypothetical protein